MTTREMKTLTVGDKVRWFGDSTIGSVTDINKQTVAVLWADGTSNVYECSRFKAMGRKVE